MAGRKVVAEPKIVKERINVLLKDDVIVEDNLDVVLSCAVTGTQAKKLSQKQMKNVFIWRYNRFVACFLDTWESYNCTTSNFLVIDNNGCDGYCSPGEVLFARSKLSENGVHIYSMFEYALPKDELEKVPNCYFFRPSMATRDS